ncbi:phosphocholine-specific phospholipase C [Acidicapsa dinghuensis]|uniref:phospholipase C n=1 Tax=Acidicapsa dinghuensis TaxID=2218256 RepID=A0ABW1EE14_9BACT|nr:phospholipase C, phosphocholine-specific [Acidicapsa dinghuensis]
MRTRRDFLRLAATAAGSAVFPASIKKALAIPASRASGTIKDVEHVVILMQENRSFDHYFGSLRGVRGFSDPRPALLPNGKPVWYQPTASVKTKHYHGRGLSSDAKYVLPFYINPKRTTEFQAGTDHGWSSGHLAWNHGHYDGWVNHKQDVLTMGYLRRDDLLFHYALADAFTICDAYHCSVHADTAPNRIYLWSGTIDAQNSKGRRANGPGFDERHKTNGYTWTTYPERLEAAGISWRLYQGGTGEPGTPTDNFTDNSLEFFAAYQVGEGASPDGPLVSKGIADRTIADFRKDIESNQLAQVSWLVPPYVYSEHPEASPRNGAYYINLVLDALTTNPEVWSRTVLIINYDENDGLFDHVVPPMPPLVQNENSGGLVSDDLLASLADEIVDTDKYPHELSPIVPGTDPGGPQPIGLGPRVPLLLISPWTRGGWVCSQVFDHTSVLRFLEARFGVSEPNISAWRRSICGDLTSAFDFSGANDTTIKSFNVPAVLRSEKKPYRVPTVQSMPRQEPGTRPARALPYEIYAHCRLEMNHRKVWIDLKNVGKTGAAFCIRNGLLPQEPPRRYSVSASRALSDFWYCAEAGLGSTPDYDLSLHGPNGYYAHFRGVATNFQEQKPEVAVQYDSDAENIQLRLSNAGSAQCTVHIANQYSEPGAIHSYHLSPGAEDIDVWTLGASSGWFDLSITADEAPLFLRRFAGHVETGRSSTSDPAMFTEEA